MIDLRTGVPGACKTLSAVEALAKMQARWEKHPEEARPVFVHGVKDLALPHTKVPLTTWIENEGGRNPKPPVTVVDWSAMPDGSYVLVDEAQDLFPPRASGAEVPPHIAWLNTHRHRGFDITVITQHPKLVNASMRALVGKHQHFRRMFGRQVAVCYEWDACSDNLGGMNNAVRSTFPFPKKAFQWYKSAEVHTKQNFKLPKWLILPVLGIIGGIFAFPYAASKVMSLTGSKAPVAVATGASSPAGDAQARTAQKQPGGNGAPRFPQYDPIPVKAERDPYDGRAIQIEGAYTVRGRTVSLFALMVDGERVQSIRGEQLEAMGYTFVSIGPCAGLLRHGGQERVVTCGRAKTAERPLAPPAPSASGVT